MNMQIYATILNEKSHYPPAVVFVDVVQTVLGVLVLEYDDRFVGLMQLEQKRLAARMYV
jgi:hypothetical protein